MDIGWDAPPDEDFDALLDDEHELEYMRELEKKQNEITNIEHLLESNDQVNKFAVKEYLKILPEILVESYP